jgi:hypothetical protein
MDRLLAALLLLAPAIAAAGPFDQPWAEIRGEGSGAPDPKYGAAVLSRVDGEPAARGRAVVAPGTHAVTVSLPPNKGMSVGAQQNLEVRANPCMRYILAASLDPQSGQWKAVVRSAETIGECLARFKGGTAPQ